MPAAGHGHEDCRDGCMSEHDEPSDGEAEAEIFRAFGLACRAERDRLALDELAEQDRRFESAESDRAAADLFAARLIAALSRP